MKDHSVSDKVHLSMIRIRIVVRLPSCDIKNTDYRESPPLARNVEWAWAREDDIHWLPTFEC